MAGPNFAKADKGVIVSAEVATAAPVEELPAPVEAIVACAAVRAASLAAELDAALAPDAARASETTLLESATALFDTIMPPLAADATAEERVGVTGGFRAAETTGTPSGVPATTEPPLS